MLRKAKRVGSSLLGLQRLVLWQIILVLIELTRVWPKLVTVLPRAYNTGGI